jgi:hypothetical protein
MKVRVREGQGAEGDCFLKTEPKELRSLRRRIYYNVSSGSLAPWAPFFSFTSLNSLSSFASNLVSLSSLPGSSRQCVGQPELAHVQWPGGAGGFFEADG